MFSETAGGECPGQAEVAEYSLHRRRVDQHVLGLQVSVDDVGAVHEPQRGQQLAEDRLVGLCVDLAVLDQLVEAHFVGTHHYEEGFDFAGFQLVFGCKAIEKWCHQGGLEVVLDGAQAGQDGNLSDDLEQRVVVPSKPL